MALSGPGGSDLHRADRQGPPPAGPAPLPTQVLGIDHVRAVAAGTIFSLVLREDGTVWGWGADCDGSLASGVAYPSQAGLLSYHAGDYALDLTYNDRIDTGPPGGLLETVPIPIRGVPPVRLIAAGGDAAYAVAEDRHVWAWGSGRLRGSRFEIQAQPVEVPCLHDIQVVVAAPSWSDVLALRADGTVWSWGDQRVSTQPDPACSDADAPAQVLGLPPMVAIMAGYTNLALAQGGSVWAWDREGLAAVGHGPVFLQQAPAPVQGLPLL